MLVPRVSPGTSSPGGGGAKPKMPDCHTRSAWPSFANRATKLEIALMLAVDPNSALHAVGLAAKVEIAPLVAPWVRICSH
ncbi:MAG: hypothetical protein E6I12_11825 [Chloroflexi bacterium]|nr:MAG: hypothetical protein E6I12_11825 [Chloroflexota bacterium]